MKGSGSELESLSQANKHSVEIKRRLLLSIEFLPSYESNRTVIRASATTFQWYRNLLSSWGTLTRANRLR